MHARRDCRPAQSRSPPLAVISSPCYNLLRRHGGGSLYGWVHGRPQLSTPLWPTAPHAPANDPPGLLPSGLRLVHAVFRPIALGRRLRFPGRPKAPTASLVWKFATACKARLPDSAKGQATACDTPKSRKNTPAASSPFCTPLANVHRARSKPRTREFRSPVEQKTGRTCMTAWSTHYVRSLACIAMVRALAFPPLQSGVRSWTAFQRLPPTTAPAASAATAFVAGCHSFRRARRGGSNAGELEEVVKIPRVRLGRTFWIRDDDAWHL